MLALRRELADGLKRIGEFAIGDYAVEVCQGADSLWALVRRAGRGGLAVRAAYAPGGFQRVRKLRAEPGEALRLEAQSAAGRFLVLDALHSSHPAYFPSTSD